MFPNPFHPIIKSLDLRKQPLGRPGVVRRKVDTRQVKEPSNNAVKTDTTATVGGHASLSEHVDVLLDAVALGVDALLDDAGLELLGVIDTLAARKDLLAAEEEVEGVGDLGVGVVKLGVEGAGALGELVEHVEVRVELLAHDGAESLLLGSAHVLVVGNVAELLGTLLAEKLLTPTFLKVVVSYHMWR